MELKIGDTVELNNGKIGVVKRNDVTKRRTYPILVSVMHGPGLYSDYEYTSEGRLFMVGKGVPHDIKRVIKRHIVQLKW